VLTFAGDGVIITKLSARATAHEFFWNRKPQFGAGWLPRVGKTVSKNL